MRMIDADDIPWAVFELTFDAEHIQWIHIVAIPSAFLVQVLADAEGMDRVSFVFIGSADHHSATLVRIGSLGVVVNLPQQRCRYFDHNSIETLTAPPLNRCIVSAN